MASYLTAFSTECVLCNATGDTVDTPLETRATGNTVETVLWG